jgi:hypothetical protein
VAAASIVGGMMFLSVHQFAVAEYGCRCCIVLFRSLVVQVTVPAPHKTGWLFALSPDMAEFLEVVALCVSNLSSIRLYPGCNMAKAAQFEYLLGLWRPM